MAKGMTEKSALVGAGAQEGGRYVVRLVFDMDAVGRRMRGRPKVRWMEVVERDRKEVGMQ